MEATENKRDSKLIEFIAVEFNNQKKVISRGFDADRVVEEAEKSGIEFLITYDFAKNHTFIF